MGLTVPPWAFQTEVEVRGVSGGTTCICRTFLQIEGRRACLPGSVTAFHPHRTSVQGLFKSIFNSGKLRLREVKSMVSTLTPCSRVLELALAGLLSWLEHPPIHQTVVSFMPGQGTYLHCRFGPWWGHVWVKMD
ncbi:hypothetical protein HJG60_008745 [Phyllostomus discolor]|uniref:Uncharacterized protein n=1 Tax=Phyllostomus discolor TaxID=89673 RepID=A0A834DI33_9CHIR|nr:hypothetical protein HJG60_008745 [Phyllostomus discolor]